MIKDGDLHYWEQMEFGTPVISQGRILVWAITIDKLGSFTVFNLAAICLSNTCLIIKNMSLTVSKYDSILKLLLIEEFWLQITGNMINYGVFLVHFYKDQIFLKKYRYSKSHI